MKKASNTDRIVAYLKRRKTPASVREVAKHLRVSDDAARAALNYAAYRVWAVWRVANGWKWGRPPPQVSKPATGYKVPRP